MLPLSCKDLLNLLLCPFYRTDTPSTNTAHSLHVCVECFCYQPIPGTWPLAQGLGGTRKPIRLSVNLKS